MVETCCRQWMPSCHDPDVSAPRSRTRADEVISVNFHSSVDTVAGALCDRDVHTPITAGGVAAVGQRGQAEWGASAQHEARRVRALKPR